MRTLTKLLTVSVGCLALNALGQDFSSSERWRFRFDIGGTIPEDPTLSTIDVNGPVTGGDKMDLSAGVSFDLAAGYRITPWLLLEAEFGLTSNEIESIGNWAYPDSALSQMLLMVNAEFSYPIGRFVPFAGIGGGGVYSSVSFGNSYYYYWSESDGSGDDFVAAAQAFAGFRIQLDPNWSIGLAYRFLATPSQNWDVEWWNGADFDLEVDEVGVHTISLSITASF